jgi:hypothetical protein
VVAGKRGSHIVGPDEIGLVPLSVSSIIKPENHAKTNALEKQQVFFREGCCWALGWGHPF